MKKKNTALLITMLVSCLTGCGRFVPSITSYNYSFESEDETKGTVTVEGDIAPGNKVKLIAHSNEYYVFSHWQRVGLSKTLSTSETYEYTLPNRDVSIVAYFKNKSYQLTTDNSVFEIRGAGTYKWGDSVSISIYSDTNNTLNKRFVSFIDGDGETLSTEPTFTYTMPKHDVYISAATEQHAYKLNVACDESGADFDDSYNNRYYPYGNDLQICASLWGSSQWNDKGFDKWVDLNTGETLTTDHVLKFVMPKHDVSIKGLYRKANLTFGEYPQSKVNDSTLKTNLNSINTFDSNGYIEFDGSKYLRESGNYYKVEPIEWIIEIDFGDTLYVHTRKVLDFKQFNPSLDDRVLDGITYKCNDYYGSSVRQWIVNELTPKAFSNTEINIAIGNGFNVHESDYTYFRTDKFNLPNIYTNCHSVIGITDYAKSKSNSSYVMTYDYNYAGSNQIVCQTVCDGGCSSSSTYVSPVELGGIALSCKLDVSDGKRALLNY